MKEWFTQVVSFLAHDGRECERINETLNQLEEDGWDIEGVELKDGKGYAVFIVATKEVK